MLSQMQCLLLMTISVLFFFGCSAEDNEDDLCPSPSPSPAEQSPTTAPETPKVNPTPSPTPSPTPTSHPTPTEPETPYPAPTPVPPDPPDVPDAWLNGGMLVVDAPGMSIMLIRMSDAAKIWEYSVQDYHPDLCPASDPCTLFEAHHVVHNDRDYVDFTMDRASNLQSSFHRVALSDPATMVFSIKGFDFSAVGGGGCDVSVSESCAGEPTLQESCFTWFVHSFQIIADDPAAKKVSMVIADHQSRILQATLDYSQGATCARVDWLLDGQMSDWNTTCMPNHVQYLEVGSSAYVLTTCRNLNHNPGQGQIQLFKKKGSAIHPSWSRVWTYPDPSSGSEPYLNVPHQGHLVAHRKDAGYDLLYAHSLGMDTNWGVGAAGTMGSAKLASIEAQPNYLADEGIGIDTSQPAFGFLKDVELLSGGYRLVTDFGSYPPLKPIPSVIYVVGPQKVVDTPQAGYWSQDHAEQNLYDVGNDIEKVYSCGWSAANRAYWLDPSQYGADLKTANFGTGTPCPAFLLHNRLGERRE